MKRVVMFSGGIGSWATAKRVAERGPATMLFADTIVEDNDLYRFVIEAAANVAGVEPSKRFSMLLQYARNLPYDPENGYRERKKALSHLRTAAMEDNPKLVWVADGRTPFEVFHDDRFLGNSRLANCSKFLKIVPCRNWLERQALAKRLFVGIDWTEIHRLPAIRKGWLPYKAEAPLTKRPFIDKSQMKDWLCAEGVELPQGYGEGFPHNNCLNQGCVRGGHGYWQLMLRIRPEAYRNTELEEERLRVDLGKDVSMLKDRFVRNGQENVVPLTLREFRERIEAQPELDFGVEGEACGCFTEDTAETPVAA